ncbi:hypothetical protein DNTS_026650 [Danionella cerebrum]|uniref:Adrenodoxin-NADP(+) reductase n=1 Tax=Danionella cerebrum TaxID=2873325 RepID=A0A553QCH6_9TELE|nr:hypothetical protein DNTS_026650 [Danionella translucida]
MQNVINTFTQTAQHERCHFHGNVNVGKDVTIEELRQAYHAVVLSYGAEGNRSMGVPGEHLSGVFSAKDFVGWYNGLPNNKELCPDLSCETAVILGQGNVALDVARILLTPVDMLKVTDITQNALEALAESKVTRVLMVGRRGPLQIACTIKELREMVNLPKTRADLLLDDFEGISEASQELPRPRKRLTELMMKTLREGSEAKLEKSWGLRFFRSPGSGDGAWSVPTGVFEDLDCGLIISSIGYKSLPIDPSVPFDAQKAIVPNEMGRVNGNTVIGTTMNDSFDTARVVIHDMETGKLDLTQSKPGAQSISELLQKRDVQTVLFSQWEKINAEEEKRGRELGKPREKILEVEEMLKIAWS